ncbi:MAG: sodium:solute symporter family protein [Chloroflexota bacterium]
MYGTAILIVYVAAMLGLGYWGMRRTRSVDDFFLGGRSIGPWMSAFAYGTTYFSAVLFVGYAGKLGWGFGHHTLWLVVGNTLVGSLLAWLVLARRTRRMTAQLGAMTMPEFLEARYGSRFLRLASALIIFVFLVPYSGSVYMGLSYLFEVNVGISYVYALTLMAVLTAVYLVMGGYFALTLTDFLRGIVEVVGAVVMVIVLVGGQGGLGTVWNQLSSRSYPGFQPVSFPSGLPLVPEFSGPGWLVLASLVLVTSLGPWGMPQMVQKFYSLKSEGDAWRAMLIASAFALVISSTAYFSGAMSHLFYTELPVDPATGVSSADYLMPKLLTEHVPGAVSLIILLLVFSASMSSLSSLVLVSSSSVAIDLYQREASPKPTQQQVMGLLRILCIVFVVASLAIALYRPVFILSLMVISWGAIGGSFIAPYVYGLFWPRANKAGAIAGLLSGLGAAVTLYVAWGEPGVPLAGATAIVVPLIVLPIVTLATQRLGATALAQKTT